MEVDRRYAWMTQHVTVDEGGCWNWIRYVQPNGYGKLTVNRKTMFAHRYMFSLVNGDIPTGLDVCHRCDNRRCINPAHLFAGTRQENMQDAVAKGRQAQGFALPNTKVGQSAAQKIVALAKAGVPYKVVAAEFGICPQHAGYIAIKHGVRRNAFGQ